MDGVSIGDLVKWQTTDKTKVGVVESVNEDGTCTISIQTKGGKRAERIRTERLEFITSTIRPQTEPGTQLEDEEPGSPQSEPPFQKL